VIHRDLKPANVFLCDDGQVKVLDLGMAHAFGHRKVDGGTPAYMAPEQWRGAPEDERTDVFALGAVLFEMLAGEPPFTGRRDDEDSAAVPQLAIPEEPALGELIRRTLATDPVKRPRDAGEVLAALSAFGHELDRAPRRGDTTLARPRPVLHGRPPRRPTEHPRPDRTWLCSVVAVEMAGYSEQSVDVQAGWRARFNARLAESIHEVPETDRVILATAGGAAVCFLGGPEAAIACAMGLVERPPEGGDDGLPEPRLRIGVHLGPVRLVRDLNGTLNALGDGVSVAERVMGFAGEDQIVVSRSFYEVASCISDTYKPLFRFGGVRHDEHVREHAVYELHPPAAAGASAPSSAGGAPARGPREAAALLLDPEAVAAIERRAAAVLGPIAHLLVKSACFRASTPRELALALAAYIPVPRERDEFLRASAAAPSSESSPRPGDTPRTPSQPRTSLDPAVLDRAARALAEHVGPVARVLVSRAAGRARSEEELHDLLAAELPGEGEREAFRARLRAPGPRAGDRR
jgi:class 3 adenylate cyclase